MSRKRLQLVALLALVSAVVGVTAAAQQKSNETGAPAEIEGYQSWTRIEGDKPKPIELASAGG